MTDDQPGGAVVRSISTPLTHPARFGFDNEQLALIKRTVARGADDNALLMFLELVGRYQLDPFVGQAYLARMPGRDGQDGTYVTIVSRDGLLAIANRYEEFKGMTGDVVRAGDMISRDDAGFHHSYEAIAAGERYQQPIIGAWAKVERAGREPTFFFAPLASYIKANKVWRSYPDAMILKVAESMALRKAFTISGLIPEDEIGATYTETSGGSIAGDIVDGAAQEPDWGEDPELAERLKLLFETANEVRPGAFRTQKVRLQLAGADQAKRQKIAQDVTDFILRHGGTIPEVPVDAETVEDPEVVA